MWRSLPDNQKSPEELGREFPFLLACVRRGLGVPGAARDAPSEARPGDWSNLVDLAMRHGVIPLLHLGLTEEPPAPVSEHLRQIYRENAIRNLSLVSQLQKIDALFTQHDIPALYYKGPLLAQTAYGDINARQCYDLDVLIAPSDEERVRELLLTEGFRLVRAYGWETQFLGPDGALNLDVHSSLSPKAFPCPLLFADLRERRENVNLGDRTLAQPGLEDLLIILCSQAAKDRWEDRLTFAKVCDIAAALKMTHALDWPRLQDRIEALAVQRVVGFGVTLAAEMLQVPMPSGWKGYAAAANGLDVFIARTVDRMQGRRPAALLSIAERLWFHFRIHSGYRHRLAQLHLVRMKFDDWLRRRED